MTSYNDKSTMKSERDYNIKRGKSKQLVNRQNERKKKNTREDGQSPLWEDDLINGPVA
jgi:hypothetical protein